MKQVLWLVILISTVGSAQKIKKADKLVLANIQTHIVFLADDKLEGRRTGTAGEKLAYEYISNEFKKSGLITKGENGTYIQPFEVYEGKQVDPSTYVMINRNTLQLDKDYFPLSFSANTKTETSGAIALPEGGAAWFFDLKELLEENKNNPHFDLEDAIIKQVIKVTSKGAAALLIFNSSAIKD